MGGFRFHSFRVKRLNQDIPLGEFRIAQQPRFDLAHRLLGEVDALGVDLTLKLYDGREAFPCHGCGPSKHRVHVEQSGAVPVLFEIPDASEDTGTETPYPRRRSRT